MYIFISIVKLKSTCKWKQLYVVKGKGKMVLNHDGEATLKYFSFSCLRNNIPGCLLPIIKLTCDFYGLIKLVFGTQIGAMKNHG